MKVKPSDKFVVLNGGHKVHFLKPKPADFEPLRVAKALAQEHRYAGNYGPYSVGQHSVLVSLGVESLGGSPRQALAGLVHDASEVVTGDLPNPLKSEIAGFRYIEALLNTAVEARYGVDLDDKIVAEADKMVLAAEVRMLVPQSDQHLFNVDPLFMYEMQPGWVQILPWTYNEVVGNFMDRHDLLLSELTGEKYERN